MTTVMEIHFVCKFPSTFIFSQLRGGMITQLVMNKSKWKWHNRKKKLVSGIWSCKFYNANYLDKQKQNY